MEENKRIWRKSVRILIALVMLFTTIVPQNTVLAEGGPITAPLILAGNQTLIDARYEVVSKRTPTSKTYEISPGSYITEVYSEPIAFQNSQGQLQDINNTLVVEREYSPDLITYRNTANAFASRFSTRLNSDYPIDFEYNQALMSMRPSGLSGDKGTIQGSTIQYTDAAANVDFAVTAENSGIKQDFTLKSNTGQHEFTYIIETENIDIISRQGSLYLEDQRTDGLIAVFTTPFAKDATGKICEDVTTTLIDDNHVAISINANWLATAAYPVTFSPQIRLVIDNHLDINLRQGTDTTGNALNGQAYIGYDDGIASGNPVANQQTRTYIYPQIPQELRDQDQTITKATFNLYTETAWGTSERIIIAEGMNQPIAPGDLSWQNQPTDLSELSRTPLPANTSGTLSFNITPLVQSWHSTGTNNGFRLRLADETQQGEKFQGRFGASSPETQPILIIEHKTPTQTPPPIRSNNPYNNNSYASDVDNLQGLDAISGAFTHQSTDIELNGSEKLAFTRSYNSQAQLTGALGNSWRHNYDYRIKEDEYTLTIDTPDNYPIIFLKDDDGSFTKPGYADFTLIRNTEGTFATFRDQSTYQFNAANQLTSITKLNGQQTILTYQNGKLASVGNRNGSLTFTYTGDTITSVTDSTNRSVSYTYSDAGMLATFTNIDQDTLRYVYNNANYLIQISNFKGVIYTEQTYDSMGRITEQYLADQGTSKVSYDSAGRQNTITNPDNSTITYTHDELYQLMSILDTGTRSYTFADNRLVTYENRQKEPKNFVYDAQGNVAEQSHADGTKESFVYNSHNLVTEHTRQDKTKLTYTYDDKGNLITKTDGRGNITTHTYDSNSDRTSTTDSLNRTTHHTYNSAGCMLTETDPLGQVTSYTYDAPNRVIAEKNPEGHTTSYTFTPGGKHTKTTNALGDEETYTVDQDNNRTELKDYQGSIEKYAYNLQNNTNSVTDKEENDRSYSYNERGYIVSSQDPEGNTSQIQYDNRGRVIGITDYQGYTSTFSYNNENSLTAIQTPNGDTNTATYDVMGRVKTITNARNNTITYTYDEMGRVTQEADAKGQIIAYTYDEDGNLIGTTDRNGNTWTYRYDSESQKTHSTDPLNGTEEIQWDIGGNPVKTISPLQATTQTGYDKNGNVISVTDSMNNTITYTYDALDRLIKQNNPDRTSVKYSYDKNGNVTSSTDEAGHTTKYTYDKNGRLLSQKDPQGNTTHYTYDKNGRLLNETDAMDNTITRTYDNNSNILTETTALGNTTTYTYDSKNRVTSIKDPLNNITQVEYDQNDNITAITNPDTGIIRYTYDNLDQLVSVTDAENYTSTTEYDANGNITKETDSRSNSQTYAYDELNRLTLVTDALSNTDSQEYDKDSRATKTTDSRQATTTTEYDAAGRVAEITDTYGHSTCFAYDTMNRVVTTTDAQGATTCYTYTPTGQITSIVDAHGNKTTYTYDKLGNLLSETDPLKRTTKYEYDKLSRPVAIIDPLGNKQKLTYDKQSRVTSVTDNNKNTTHYTYDANDNITETKDAKGTVTRYTYDGMNQLTQLTLNRIDPQSGVNEQQITLYQYDKRGLLTQTIDPQQNTTINTYDGNGNLTQAIDADGITIQTSHDKRNLVEQINTYAAGSTTPDKTAAYTYDEEGNLIQSHDWTGQTTFEYDLLSQITKVTDQNKQTTRTSYDAVGNQTRLVNPDGSIVSKTYNKLSQLTCLLYKQDPTDIHFPFLHGPNRPLKQQTQQTIYTYNKAGEQTSVQYPNGLLEESTYDKNGQITQIHESDLTQKKPKTQLKYQCIYDPQGNVTYEYKRQNGDQPEEKNTYSYDALNQLISSQNAKDKTPTAYTYDTLGNLTQETIDKTKNHQDITQYTYNSLNQQISKQEIDRTLSKKNKTDKIKETQLNTFDKRGNLIQTEKQTCSQHRNPHKTCDKNTCKNTILAQYTYDTTNTMSEGINEKAETSEYTHNSLGALTGETKLIAKDAYGYTDVDAQPQDKRPSKHNKDKTSLIEKHYTIDYTSELQNKIAEKETNGLSYTYVYGTEKISANIQEKKINKGKTIAEITIETETIYYHHDSQGSTDTLTDTCGKTVSTAGYDAWGVPKKSDPLKQGKRKLDLVTEYTGYSYDTILKIHNAKARMYDAKNRRFMAQDIVPGNLETPQTLVRYPYVTNNPKTYTDPTGEFLDTLFDVVSLGVSIYDFVKEPSLLNAGFLLWDVVALVPGIPGSYVGKSIKYGTEAAQRLTREATQEATQEAAQTIVKETTQQIAEEGTEKALKEATQQTEQEIAQRLEKERLEKEIAEQARKKLEKEAAQKAAAETAKKQAEARAKQEAADRAKKEAQERAKKEAADRQAKQAKELADQTAPQNMCFTPETLVATEEGNKEIQDIQVGDLVYAINPETGEDGLKQVKQVFENETKQLIHVKIEEEDIQTTPEHPFWVVDKGWVGASQIKQGDTVQLLGGKTATVEGVETETLEDSITVYNFEVEDWHTYVVSGIRVLVHNKCDGPGNGTGNPGSSVPGPNSGIRGDLETGGFARGISANEISEINRSFGNAYGHYRDPSIALFSAANRHGFYNKLASVVRDIAGSHMFADANKRTAYAVAQELLRRNQIVSGPNSERLWNVISRVANSKSKNYLSEIDDIAAALRGF